MLTSSCSEDEEKLENTAKDKLKAEETRGIHQKEVQSRDLVLIAAPTEHIMRTIDRTTEIETLEDHSADKVNRNDDSNNAPENSRDRSG